MIDGHVGLSSRVEEFLQVRVQRAKFTRLSYNTMVVIATIFQSHHMQVQPSIATPSDRKRDATCLQRLLRFPIMDHVMHTVRSTAITWPVATLLQV